MKPELSAKEEAFAIYDGTGARSTSEQYFNAGWDAALAQKALGLDKAKLVSVVEANGYNCTAKEILLHMIKNGDFDL